MIKRVKILAKKIFDFHGNSYNFCGSITNLLLKLSIPTSNSNTNLDSVIIDTMAPPKFRSKSKSNGNEIYNSEFDSLEILKNSISIPHSTLEQTFSTILSIYPNLKNECEKIYEKSFFKIPDYIKAEELLEEVVSELTNEEELLSNLPLIMKALDKLKLSTKYLISWIFAFLESSEHTISSPSLWKTLAEVTESRESNISNKTRILKLCTIAYPSEFSWSLYLRSLEKNNSGFVEMENEVNRLLKYASECKCEELVHKGFMILAGYYSRSIIHQNSEETENFKKKQKILLRTTFQRAIDSLELPYSTHISLEWAQFEAFVLKDEAGLKNVMERLLKENSNSKKHEIWTAYAKFQMTFSIEGSGNLLKRAVDFVRDNHMGACLDLLNFQRLYGDLPGLEEAEIIFQKATKSTNKRSKSDFSEFSEFSNEKGNKRIHTDTLTGYISNLPLEFNQENLENFLNEKKITFQEARLVVSNTGASKGFAYIDLPSNSELTSLLALNSTIIDGKSIFVAKSAPPKSVGPTSKTLFVNNLPIDISKENLKKVYEQLSEEIVDIRMVRKEGAGKCFAFIEFTSKEKAAEGFLVKLFFNGKHADVHFSDSDSNTNSKSTSIHKPNSHQLDSSKGASAAVIKGLPFNCSPEDAKAFIESKWKVRNVQVPGNGKGKCKGYAFVEFEYGSELASAIRGKTEMEGRELKIEKSTRQITKKGNSTKFHAPNPNSLENSKPKENDEFRKMFGL